jgi:predicted aconitase
LLPPSSRTLVTNSAKYAHYAPALAKKRVRFASLERCVAAARTGVVPREAPGWLVPG